MMVWKGRLRGASALGLRGIEHEERAAILQDESHAAHGDAGAER